jgi:subtilisin family serine protease
MRDRSFRRLTILGFAAAAATAVAVGAAGPAAAAEGTVLGADSAKAIPGSYIVVLKDSAQSFAKSSLTGKFGGQVKDVWTSALHGFSATMTAQQARRAAADPSVAFVEQDQVVSVDTTQTNPPSYGIDRVDQRNLPLSASYTFNTTASNVNAYVIDTGIRVTHQTFGGRATFDANFVGDGINTDCNGHGTHVSGTIGGSQFGIAKGIHLHAVKVLDCNGSGSITGVINGVNFVAQRAVHPAVANMSLGGGASTALDNAVRNAISSGVTFAVAAGNSNANACNSSPSRVTQALVVNASDRNDARASFSNFGTCTDLYAPGVAITSAWMTSDTATNTISGTSMATPHVAGVAALFLATHPTASAATVEASINNTATTNHITGNPANTPNRLLFTNGM